MRFLCVLVFGAQPKQLGSLICQQIGSFGAGNGHPRGEKKQNPIQNCQGQVTPLVVCIGWGEAPVLVEGQSETTPGTLNHRAATPNHPSVAS